ncbi:serine/threonine-protein kinase [Georgenia satyanarayanai]|uniref:serine/threonine-protein kinase n=1 Tax=Georgenia satyanarayanai TaxID=860221 RepID=UPI00126571AF|nr:serine/threonine-protein kinase [Georgenia satyanarayanai]
MTGRLGRYRLEEVIGVGSFATVHRAVDDRLDDVVVVKVLAENHSLNPEVRERFIAEGRALRRVSSSHVVTIHDIGESERQQPYLVLEHADRGTLAARVAELRNRGWTPGTADVLATARSLAAAVEAVHRARLVHRDLSPGNILLRSTSPQPEPTLVSAVVRPDERMLVADLGMCKDLALNSGLTVAGGTQGFRPPEQHGPGVVDTRADLWAMSALLLWMCEGGDLAPALLTALRRSTADDPEDRHPDVASWLTDVEAALTPPPPPASERPAPAPDGRRWRRGAVLGASLALVLAVVGGLVGGTWIAGGGVPDRSGSATVAVEGPSEITVGEQATFTALVEGVDSWVWTMPSGSLVLDEPDVSTTARSPGTARVVLRARAPDGTDLESVHHLTVTE